MAGKARDYDAPRKHAGMTEEPETDSLEELQVRRHPTATAVIDIDDEFALPDTDVTETLYGEDETLPVVPMTAKEFRCSNCFLVFSIGRRAYKRNGDPICTDCA